MSDDGVPPGDAFELECTDCPFETLVRGEFADALEVVEAHQDAHLDDSLGHFVNVHRRG